MNGSIILSQEHYIGKIIKRFGHFDAKSMSTSYDANTPLMKNRDDHVTQSKHTLIIGSLMHLIFF